MEKEALRWPGRDYWVELALRTLLVVSFLLSFSSLLYTWGGFAEKE